MTELVLTNVQKAFHAAKGRGVVAVQGVSLTVEAGELMVLVGPSGCGKTTLLRLVAGLETIDGGTITLAGRVINDVPPADRDVAMVFQSYALFPHLSVFDNMALSLKFRRVPKVQISDAVREAAAMLRVEELLDRKPHQLSGGQRQRVALGRAMVRRPKIFLLDEPLSNLDARLRAEMREEIARLHERLKATMIFVTHDQTEAMTLGQRICVLNEGRVMQTGTPVEVYRRPANTFVAQFIGSPGMNLLRGPLATELARGVVAFDGKSALLGVRPEDVELIEGDSGVRGHIEVCEPLGHETILHIAAAGDQVVSRVQGMREFAPGQEVRLRLRAGRVSLFDEQSREALS
ncbi:MAG TPA: ABC transporter ATP-binding protein [Verrucomicrobiae bacterium]|jgi:multiple sugar transport system ATP-binding protein